MKTRTRKGLAFILRDGVWAHSTTELVRLIGDLTPGSKKNSCETRMPPIGATLIAISNPGWHKRLLNRVRSGEIATEGMDVINLAGAKSTLTKHLTETANYRKTKTAWTIVPKPAAVAAPTPPLPPVVSDPYPAADESTEPVAGPSVEAPATSEVRDTDQTLAGVSER